MGFTIPPTDGLEFVSPGRRRNVVPRSWRRFGVFRSIPATLDELEAVVVLAEGARSLEAAANDREQPSPPPASASSAAPPATVPAAKDVADTEALPDLAGTLASLAAGQRHILAMLGDIAAADGEGRAGVAEIARMIADMKQMTTATSEWTNQTKSVTHTLQAAAGQQIEGLKGGQRDLRAVAAELKIREEGIAGRLETFGKAVRELDTLLK